jgi:N-methylhydantoinase A
VSTVLVPPSPGALSALGLLAAPLAADASLTRPMREPDPAEVAALLEDLCRRASEALGRQGAQPAAVVRRVDCRYVGQAHEVTVDVEGDLDLDRLARSFAAEHRARFGWDAVGEPVELVTFRVRALGPDPGLRLPEVPPGAGARPVEGRPPGEPPAYLREDLGAGDRLEGPCLVWGEDATAVVDAGWAAEVDRHGSLVLRGEGGGR